MKWKSTCVSSFSSCSLSVTNILYLYARTLLNCRVRQRGAQHHQMGVVTQMPISKVMMSNNVLGELCREAIASCFRIVRYQTQPRPRRSRMPESSSDMRRRREICTSMERGFHCGYSRPRAFISLSWEVGSRGYGGSRLLNHRW